MSKKVNSVILCFAIFFVSFQVSFGQGKVARNNKQTIVQSSTPKKKASVSKKKPAPQISSNSATPPKKRSKPSGYVNGYEAVDLGLSVRWASCNVGAKQPSDFGEMFTFGDVTGKKYTGSERDYISGNIINTPNDMAKYHMGSGWRLPSEEECKELLDKCKTFDVVVNGVAGTKFYGPNGNSIFIPYAGIAKKKYSIEGNSGSASTPRKDYCATIWCGDALGSSVRGIKITPSSCHFSYLLFKHFGYSVRGVTD